MLTAAGALLLTPFIAMQFTGEVKWKPTDFAIMGTLLSGTVFLCELVLRKVKSVTGRLCLIGTVLLVFLLIWAELAVGIFGTPYAGS